MSNIKRASISDLDELVGLFDQYRIFYQKETNLSGAYQFLKERIEKNESTIFLALNEQRKAIGFTQLYPYFSSTRMSRLLLLNDLYVDPNFRGKGYSKMLIQAAKEYAMENQSVGLLLETAKSNEIGNNLYPSVGFELDNDHNYYFWTA
ncbi:MAG: GNAT family N-acetyltransferase [Bacteroidetes bacterium]|nr:GNAT family N-acetyltransferase [Bacteroidota bacterium]